MIGLWKKFVELLKSEKPPSVLLCDHDYVQMELTCIGICYYPEQLKHKCSKCGDVIFKRNKYMLCCKREKKVKKKCKYCGRSHK